MNRYFRLPQRVICVGLCVFQGQAGSPGSDGASPYHTSSLHSSESERFILYIEYLAMSFASSEPKVG
jgi:hypothetical protein